MTPQKTFWFLVLTVALLVGCGEPENPACVNTLCTAGASQCSGNAVATCAADGKTWEYSGCGSNQFCQVGVCQARKCTHLGTGECINGSTLMRCTVDGRTKVEETCPDKTTCVSGECVKESCTGLQTACAFTNWVLSCENGVWGGEECSGTDICSDASGSAKCISQVCTPEAARCDGNTAMLCDHEGRIETVTPCAANEVCKEGFCVTKVCGLDDVPNTPADVTADVPDGIDAVTDTVEEEDVFIPPLQPISRVEFELKGQDYLYDLNARAIYIGPDKSLMIIGEKGLSQIEIRIGPIDSFTVGSWNESDGAEVGVALCFNDGVSELPPPLEPCQVGFTHVSIEYTLAIDDNNGPDSWIRGSFTATLEDVNGEIIRLKDGIFEVLHK